MSLRHPERPLSLVPVVLALASASSSVSAQGFECLVEPYVEVKISSAVPGILEDVNVDRGDFVVHGQVLAALKSEAERANLDLAKARAAFAARKAERNKEMYRKRMISAQEKDELETELEVQKLEVREIEERLKLRTIVSPVDGVVVKRHYSPGEYVEEKPILEIAQIDPLRVEVVVPFSLYGRVRIGTIATVSWEAPIKGAFPATVKVVDPVVDAASGTIGVRLELPNPDHKLPAGTKCSVVFPGVAERASSGR